MINEVEVFMREAIEAKAPPTAAMVRELLEFCGRRVPYYAEVSRNLSEAACDLSRWPVLTKDIIRQVGDRLKADDHLLRDCIETTSGGSTGRPVRVLHDKIFRERAEATRRYHTEHVMGLSRNMSQVILWGSQRDIFNSEAGSGASVPLRLKDWALRQMNLKTTVLDALRMSREDLSRYLDVINEEKPEVIHAYAGSLYQLARYARDHDVKMHSPYRIYTTAEMLRPFMRELIEDVFKTHVYDFYGSREVGPIAGEGPGGRLFTFDFFNVVEVVDDNDQPVGPGQQGRLLVTTLHNRAMPLVRYEVGDLAVRGEPSSTLGCELGTLEKVVGRMSDQFVTANGSLIHGGYFTRLFYFCDFVDQFQVTQTEVDAISIAYVPLAMPLSDQIADIEAKIRLAMGQECTIEWQRVERIPLTPEGKLLYTRSLLSSHCRLTGARLQ